jgi:hypothetical protein
MTEMQPIAMNRMPCGCVVAYNAFIVPNTNPIQIAGQINFSRCPKHEHAEELYAAVRRDQDLSLIDDDLSHASRVVAKIASKG